MYPFCNIVPHGGAFRPWWCLSAIMVVPRSARGVKGRKAGRTSNSSASMRSSFWTSLVSVQASCPFKKLGRVVRPIQEVGAGHSTEGDGRGWPVIGLGIPTLQDNHNVKVLLLQCRARRDECLRPTWRALVRERVPARPRGPTDDVCEELRQLWAKGVVTADRRDQRVRRGKGAVACSSSCRLNVNSLTPVLRVAATMCCLCGARMYRGR